MTTDEGDESHSQVDAPDTTALAASLTADDPTERQQAAREVEQLAADRTDEAVAFVDGLVALLDDESLAVVRAAAEALVPIAHDRPATLVDDLDSVVELLAADTADIALAGAETLAPVAVEHPEAVAPHVDRLCALLAEGEPSADAGDLPDSIELPETRAAIQDVVTKERERQRYVRETAANVVVAVAEADPTRLTTEVDTLERLLDDSNAVVVGCVVDALGLLGEVDPEAVAPVCEPLVACLDHDVPTVRARTVRALGLVGDVAHVPRLREVADSDPEEDVRDLAAETAAFLED